MSHPFRSCRFLLNIFDRKYLSDPTEDIRVATETLLADFLREIRDVSIVRRQLDGQAKTKTPAESLSHIPVEPTQEKPIDLTLENSERAVFIGDNDYQSNHDSEAIKEDFASSNLDDRDTGGEANVLIRVRVRLHMFLVWILGQGVRIDYAAIVEILIQQLDSERQ